MKKIAIINNKGGVGKSTMAVQLAHGLAKLEKKTLLLDLDDQNDSSMFLGIPERDFKNTFYDLILQDNISIDDCIINTRPNLDVLPNSNYDKLNTMIHNERLITNVMGNYLKELEYANYDFLIIDCTPTKNKINDAVIFYVEHILMPVQLESASVRGAGNMYRYLFELDQPKEKISLIIPNMYDQRTNESKENLKKLKKFFEDEPGKVSPPIHRRVKITEAGKKGKTVFEYDKEASEQFKKILREVVHEIV